MKRFKIGLLAFIAVLAMSFSVAENTGAFEKLAKAPSALGDCYTNIMVGGTLWNNQDCVQEPPIAAGACAQASNSAVFVTNVADPKESGEVCADGEDVFCCAKIGTDPSCPLTLIPAISSTAQRYSIIESYCKPQQ